MRYLSSNGLSRCYADIIILYIIIGNKSRNVRASWLRCIMFFFYLNRQNYLNTVDGGSPGVSGFHRAYRLYLF